MRKPSPHIANILRIYGQASAEEIQSGLTWYVCAQNESVRRTGLNKPTACGIVAALSPRLPWGRNIQYAEQFVRTRSCGQTGDCIRTASRILSGWEPEMALKGPKTRAFYECLCNPQDPHWVCVDRHAYCVWLGRRLTTTSQLKMTPKLLHVVAVDYRLTAKLTGLLPSQLQAITWVTWRRIHDVDRRYD